MTTLAIVFGTLPLVFAHGAGAQARYNIGIVLLSGMSLGTVFTLFILPVLYFFISAHSFASDSKDIAHVNT